MGMTVPGSTSGSGATGGGATGLWAGRITTAPATTIAATMLLGATHLPDIGPPRAPSTPYNSVIRSAGSRSVQWEIRRGSGVLAGSRRGRGSGVQDADRAIGIRHALRTISADRAEALILCFFSGLSFAEAGLVLRKSESAVKMLISRGLQDLRTRTSLALEVDYE